MIVFDLTDKESFNNIDSWLQEVQKHCGNEVNILIIANKADVGTKNLNAGVFSIGNVDESGTIDCNSVRKYKLSRTTARLTPGKEELPFFRIFMDAGIAVAIGNIHIT